MPTLQTEQWALDELKETTRVLLGSTINLINRLSATKFSSDMFTILSVTPDEAIGEKRWVVEAKALDKLHLRVYHFIDEVSSNSSLYYEEYTDDNPNIQLREVTIIDEVTNLPNTLWVKEGMITHVVRVRPEEYSDRLKTRKALVDTIRLLAFLETVVTIPDDAIVNTDGDYLIDHVNNAIIHTGDEDI